MRANSCSVDFLTSEMTLIKFVLELTMQRKPTAYVYVHTSMYELQNKTTLKKLSTSISHKSDI